jgi:hypothetical protein
VLELLKPVFLIYLWNYVLIFNRHYNLCVCIVYTSPNFRQEIFWKKLNYSIFTHDNILTNTYLLCKRQLKVYAVWHHCMVIFNHFFCKKYVVVKILSKGIFISVSVSESCDEVCRHKLPYNSATLCFQWIMYINQNFIKGHFHLNIYQGIML